MKSYLYAAVITVLAATSVTAQTPKSYLCEVKNAYELSDAGALQSATSPIDREIGKRFQINIETGEIIGPASFSSRFWERISVLNPGTRSFLKVIYTFHPPNADFTKVAYLETGVDRAAK